MHWQALHRARNVPVLIVDPGDSRPAHRQIADTLAEMIRSGQLRVGERLPSVREMSEGGVPTASARHALGVLTEEGLITSRAASSAISASRAASSGLAVTDHHHPGILSVINTTRWADAKKRR
jgi:DNA-binding transcriptional regulator YhcF (GntR family)